MIKLAIVCPCYNEEEVLPDSVGVLCRLLGKMKESGLIRSDSFLMLVNDGSSDRTWDEILALNKEYENVAGINLSHNVGHQKAIMAGMFTAIRDADAVITIDVDLQDDIECIPQMVEDYYKGYDVVYGVRSDRKTDRFLKRFTAQSFYKLQHKLGVETIYNHADFRFMSKRVVEELEKYGERNLYLRGIIPMMGFPSTQVLYSRGERKAGTTKYSLKKMLLLALNGVTSFSVAPLYAVMATGAAFLLVAMGIAVYVAVSIAIGNTAKGWSSLMLSIWFVGGVLLFSMGLVGLYVGRIFIESKHRPLYHIQDSILARSKEN